MLLESAHGKVVRHSTYLSLSTFFYSFFWFVAVFLEYFHIYEIYRLRHRSLLTLSSTKRRFTLSPSVSLQKYINICYEHCSLTHRLLVFWVRTTKYKKKKKRIGFYNNDKHIQRAIIRPHWNVLVLNKKNNGREKKITVTEARNSIICSELFLFLFSLLLDARKSLHSTAASSRKTQNKNKSQIIA